MRTNQTPSDHARPAAPSLTLDIREAAALAGVSPTTLYEAARRNELPTIRLGRRLLVQRRAFERMLSGEDGAA